MDAIQALVLGIVQGITEWLPVSSSGHLVITQQLLGIHADESLLFDLVVHLGTLFAVIVYFRKELGRIVLALFTRAIGRSAEQSQLRKLGVLLIIGTVPAALAGVIFKDQIEEIFDIRLVGIALVANGFFLFAASRFASEGNKRAANLLDAIVIGLLQAVSIIPGISRSGSTLCGGMFRGLQRETAAVFAFLLSVPTLIGAFGYGFLTLERYDATLLTSMIGLVSAFAVGLVSIDYLLKAVRRGKLWIFGAYCVIVGIAVSVLTTV